MEQRDDWHLTELLHNAQGRGDPFAAAVRATRMPMVITDPNLPDNPIVFANEAFQALCGYGRDEIVGHNCRFLQGPDTDRTAVDRIGRALAAHTSIDIDLLNYRKDGSSFWNALYLSPVRGDDGTLKFYFASQMDVTGRVNAQAIIAEQKAAVEREVASRTKDLEDALEAKTLLLHEVDHRVKNNLNMIGSLLRLQARTIDDTVVAGKLGAMLERVDALATVHRRLYQADDITRFDIGAFTSNLVADVIAASGRHDIVVQEDVQSIEIPSSHASALGLVLNEIVTNALKHAFPDGQNGTLLVSATTNGATAHLRIADDGLGLPEPPARHGLGRTLIDRLSRQVGATIEYTRLTPGTGVTVSFPVGS